MNGVRTTFMRRGYLLTALSALLLLAASAGTAEAQAPVTAVTLDKVTLSVSTERVTEGDTLTVTVRGEARVPAKVNADGTPANDDLTDGDTSNDDDRPTNRAERTAVVNLQLNEVAGIPGVSTTGDLDDNGQVTDANIVTNAQLRLVFGENTGSSERERTATATATVQINDDPDAENEALSVGLISTGGDPVTLGGTAVSAFTSTTVPAADFTIIDTDTQTYVLELDETTHDRTNPPTENEDIVVKVSAKPPHYQGSATLTLHVRKDGGRALGYTATGEALTGANASESQRGKVVIGNGVDSDTSDTVDQTENSRIITISQTHDRANQGENGDGNRVTDTITLSAYAGAAGAGSLAAGPFDIDVLDLHGLPGPDAITAVARDEDGNEVEEIAEGGDPVYLTITVDRGTGASATTNEQLTVDIRSADGTQVADYDLSLDRVVLEEQSSGKQSNDRDDMIELSARADEDVGTETLTLHLEVSGESKKGTETETGVFEIDITDMTMKKVEPKSEEDAYPEIEAAIEAGAGDEGLNPGESFSVMTSDLFDVADGYTASYGVTVEGDPAVSVTASTESIMVTANEAGESKVTVTATARMASSSFQAEQTMSNAASITFPVTVVDKDLEVMLEMPDGVMDGNIVEGNSYDINVTANRMVHEDTEVMIMRDRSASDASDDDFTVSSATIMAGYDSTTAELMVTEDMEDDAGHGMGEVLVLYGEVNGEETNALTFTIWDEAVPALPLIGQLLLALFLMAGGTRLYRRRQS